MALTNEEIGERDVTVRVIDSGGLSDQGTFKVTIENVNDAPELDTLPDQTTQQDASFRYQLSATDIDMDISDESLSYELVSGPDWLSLSSTGLLSGTPTNDEVGERDVTVRVIDSGGLSDQGTFSLTIENVNDAPELDTLPDQTTDEHASFRYQLSATDIDLDIFDESLSYELVSGPDWLSLSSTGLLSGTPTNDEVGERDVTVKVIDSGGLSDQGTFKLTVMSAADVSLTVGEEDSGRFGNKWSGRSDSDGVVTASFDVSDPTQDLVLSLTGYDIDYDDEVSVSLNGDRIGYLDKGVNLGTSSHQMKLSSSELVSGQNDLSFEVKYASWAWGVGELKIDKFELSNPEFDTLSDQTTQQDASFRYQLSATDIDMDIFDESLSYELVSGPDWLSLSSTGLLSGTPTNDEVGERDVTIRVIDSGGLSDQGTFKVTIENVNDAPELDTLPDQTIDEDASFRYQLSATDIDLDISDESLSYELVSGPDWLSLSSTGLLSGTPTNDEVGERDVTVRVIDSGDLSDQGTFKITVENVNDAPELEAIPDQSVFNSSFIRINYPQQTLISLMRF